VNDRLATWRKDLVNLIDTVRRLPLIARDLVHGMPPGDPQHRLDVLVELWEALALASPARSVSPQLAAKETADHWAAGFSEIPPLVVALVHNLEVSIAQALAAGGRHAGVVQTADFQDGLQFRTTPGGFLPIVFGLRSSLPADHPLLSALAADECLQSPDGLLFVLGAAVGGISAPRAKAWYDVLGSLALTREWRERQLREEDAKRQDEERRKAADAERRRWNTSPAQLQDQVASLQHRVAELELQQAGRGGPVQ
jgi:hypothetical protein